MIEADPRNRAPRVLVTAVTSDAGLAVVRDLGRSGFRVHGATSRPLPLGLHSRYSTAYLSIPKDEDPGFGASVLEMVRRLRPEVFFPLSTRIVGLVARYRATYDRLTKVLVPPYDAFRVADDRARTAVEFSALGVPCPALLSEEEALRNLRTGSGVTVVVKPRRDWGGGRGIVFCSDPRELESSVRECEAEWGEAFLQEFIPGDTTAMRAVQLLFDRQSRLVSHFAIRKIRQWPTKGGVTAMGISAPDDALLERIVPFFEKLRWQGPAEVELKIDPRDGLAKVIEVNPRFGGYVGFACRCGVNLPTLAVRAALGRVLGPEEHPYAAGARYLHPTAYAKAVTADWRDGVEAGRVVGALWQELRGGALRSSADASDPMPGLGVALRRARKVVKASVSGVRRAVGGG